MLHFLRYIERLTTYVCTANKATKCQLIMHDNKHCLVTRLFEQKWLFGLHLTLEQKDCLLQRNKMKMLLPYILAIYYIIFCIMGESIEANTLVEGK